MRCCQYCAILIEGRPNKKYCSKACKKAAFSWRLQGIDGLVAVELKKESNGLCDICGGPPVEPQKHLGVDHHHASGRLRGLLCRFCNVKIEWFIKNEPAILAYKTGP